VSEDVLERVYQESLEERIISYLSEEENISLEEAMNIYYNSKLANRIHQGEYGKFWFRSCVKQSRTLYRKHKRCTETAAYY